jgi:hypothetical protein
MPWLDTQPSKSALVRRRRARRQRATSGNIVKRWKNEIGRGPNLVLNVLNSGEIYNRENAAIE